MRSLFEFKRSLPRGLYVGLGSLSFLVLLAGWQLTASLHWVPEYFLPAPLRVLEAAYDLFAKYELLGDLRVSFVRVTAGYLLAVVVAVPVGVLVGSFSFFEALIEPLNNFVRYTPLPAFVPLMILWLGIGDLNQITFIFLGVFWSLIVLVADAVASVPKEYLETAYTLGTKRRDVLFFVILPYSSPSIYDSLRVAVGLAWSSLVLAEIVGASSGVGHMIVEAQRFLRTPNVIAGILLIGTIGVILDYAFKAFYPVLFPWSVKVAPQG